MELIPVKNMVPQVADIGVTINEVLDNIQVISDAKPFIEANTIQGSLKDIKQHHIIPVFIKDNEPVISHGEFIESALTAINEVYAGEIILNPNIRLSHPVKGRVPDARYKAASELLEHEKTIYYERMAFVVEIPSIYTEVDGNRLNLTVGGVKAYNLDNLYNRSGADQHFKIFVGFKNTVCTNLCISTDGYQAQLKVKSLARLQEAIHALLKDYNPIILSNDLKKFSQYELTEQQFAHIIGRCRMYKYMPESSRSHIMPLQFGDSQINAVCRDYYADNSFCSAPDGSINLWKLYNLFTGANKTTYIDSMLDRGVNAYQLVRDIQYSLETKEHSWFLN